MKYYKKLDVYKSSNVIIDSKRDAYSYARWKFYDAETGVFNDTFYSQSTCKHQSKAIFILNSLNMPVHLVLKHTKANLTDVPEAIESEIDAVKSAKYKELSKLNSLKNQDGTRGQKYKGNISCMNERLEQLEFYLKKVSK